MNQRKIKHTGTGIGIYTSGISKFRQKSSKTVLQYERRYFHFGGSLILIDR
jgi:hypothetical protein